MKCLSRNVNKERPRVCPFRDGAPREEQRRPGLLYEKGPRPRHSGPQTRPPKRSDLPHSSPTTRILELAFFLVGKAPALTRAGMSVCSTPVRPVFFPPVHLRLLLPSAPGWVWPGPTTDTRFTSPSGLMGALSPTSLGSGAPGPVSRVHLCPAVPL